MKQLILLLSLMLLFTCSSSFAQTGWVAQTSGVGTTNLSGVHFLNAATGVAVGANGTIIKTTNGGTTWSARTSLTANALFSVYFASSTSVIAVGQFGIILRSTNAGDNWTNQTTGNQLNSVHFPSALVGYAVGATGTILKTTNGGVNWIAQTSGTTLALSSVHFLSDSEGYSSGATGRIQKTTNGGTTWTALTSGTTAALNGSNYINTSTGWVTGTGGAMRKTTNGGTNWVAQVLSGTLGTMTSVKFVDANSGWSTGAAGRINFSANGGTNWSTQTSPSTNDLNALTMFNATTGWIVGNGGVVLKTTTGGLSLPTAPTLTSPANGSSNVSVTPTFTWGAVSGAISYRIQISTISNFGVITDSAIVTTNSYTIASGILQNATAYFWRVNASNSVGTGPNSSVFSFSTTVTPPPVPVHLSPANNSNGQSTTPTLVWQAIPGVTSFHVQVSTLSNFAIITDSGSVAGNLNQRTIPAGRLGNGLTYFWRVRATNASGTGSFSSPWNFSTLPTGVNVISIEVPKEFKLYNNYPNPFNPTTKIRFSVPKSEVISLKVYDNTGKMITELVNNNFTAGTFETEWNASNMSSGVYFFKLESASFIETKRMLLVK